MGDGFTVASIYLPSTSGYGLSYFGYFDSFFTVICVIYIIYVILDRFSCMEALHKNLH